MIVQTVAFLSFVMGAVLGTVTTLLVAFHNERKEEEEEYKRQLLAVLRRLSD